MWQWKVVKFIPVFKITNNAVTAVLVWHWYIATTITMDEYHIWGNVPMGAYHKRNVPMGVYRTCGNVPMGEYHTWGNVPMGEYHTWGNLKTWTTPYHVIAYIAIILCIVNKSFKGWEIRCISE